MNRENISKTYRNRLKRRHKPLMIVKVGHRPFALNYWRDRADEALKLVLNGRFN